MDLAAGAGRLAEFQISDFGFRILSTTSLHRNARALIAFTLIELLIVLAVIGALATISLPAIRGMRQSNTMAAANRQLLDDIAYARQRAIADRTTVHIIFVPPDIQSPTYNINMADLSDRRNYTNLLTGPYTTYRLFAERTVGDQPGQPRFRYLDRWKTLPEGVFIAEREFEVLPQRVWAMRPPETRPFNYLVTPFPSSGGRSNEVPHIAFDAQGSLVSYDAQGNRLIQDEVIELARGSILWQRDESTGALLSFDVQERPPFNSLSNYNHIRIDGLTGRARIERPEIQ
jgi:prepilin-type N-terminal cleavage/methylation domain-containing protein